MHVFFVVECDIWKTLALLPCRLVYDPRNFSCDVNVRRPSVHSFGGGGGGGGWGWGEGIRFQPVGGRSMLYSLGGKSYDAIVQPAFFLAGNCARNGMPIVVAFKNLFTLNSLRMLWPQCSVSSKQLFRKENGCGNRQWRIEFNLVAYKWRATVKRKKRKAETRINGEELAKRIAKKKVSMQHVETCLLEAEGLRSWQGFGSSYYFFNRFFALDLQNEIQLLSGFFCYSWLAFLFGLWLRNALLDKKSLFSCKNKQALVTLLRLTGCVKGVEKSLSDSGLTWWLLRAWVI